MRAKNEFLAGVEEAGKTTLFKTRSSRSPTSSATPPGEW